MKVLHTKPTKSNFQLCNFAPLSHAHCNALATYRSAVFACAATTSAVWRFYITLVREATGLGLNEPCVFMASSSAPFA